VRLLSLSLLILVAGVTAAVAAAEDAVWTLPEVTVEGVAPPADGGAGNAAAWARPGPPPLFVAAQGAGAQADLSVRGSSFSEVGYAVAGLALRNPQTEHFNAELPLPAELFGEFRALTGVDQALGSTGHLAGSVAAEFAALEPSTALRLEAGEGGSYGGRVWRADRWGADSGWGSSAFGWHQRAAGLDYGHNRAEANGGGLHLQYRAADTAFDTVVAAQEKDFGARGFYGASATRPAVESTDDVLWLSSCRLGLSDPRDYVRLTASVRSFRDDYILDERDASYYRNRHATTTAGVAVDGRLSGSEALALTWRTWAEDERIDSQGVFKGADTAGLGQHNRQRLGLLLAPEWTLGALTLRGGGQVVACSAESPVPLALAGLEVAAGRRQRLYASATEQVRQPSFTELDYESPASLGNAGLENERSLELEAGVKTAWSPRWQSRTAVFRRQTRHTVDWIRQTPEGRWLATDLGRVSTDGVEAELSCRLSPRFTSTLFGQWLAKQGDRDVYASRYVYNYPAQRGGLTVSWWPWSWCELRTQQVMLGYADNAPRTSGRWGTDSTLAGIVHPACWPAAALGVEVANLYADDTQFLPGQRRASQSLMGTLVVRW
jgi:iron complex outermembrane receptor protein